ncbi:MAG: TatD DNase family protein [Cellvibrionaceae bacterium]|jgi:TatD DNase family protein
MFIDAHTHLDHYRPDEIDDVLAEIDLLPCHTWAVSTDLESWDKTQALAQGRPLIMPTFGIHPWNAHLYADRLDELDEPTAESAFLGEIGLDFHWVEERERWPMQEIVLDYFFKKATQQNKVVNLHTKGAEELILKKLRQFKIKQAVVHWYSGDVATFDQFVKQGCLFTFGVELAHNEMIQACAQRCPAGQLLTETDGPGGLEWLTGERARPGVVPGVVELLGQLRGEDPAGMPERIWDNYCRLMS